MKQLFLLFFLHIVLVGNCGNIPGLIPKPMKMESGNGNFSVKPEMIISCNDTRLLHIACFMNEFLKSAYNFQLTERQSKKLVNGINLIYDSSFEKEHYHLSVTDQRITIKGDTAGVFYGIQTLMQLMPVDPKYGAVVPHVEIEDKPRFSYRGAMLDVGRYFFTPSYIKRFIDLMAYYKLNVLHWHLTEDGGWRLEIKKYPQLATIGAWRQGTQNTRATDGYDKLPYGGYYTQDQVRDIVRYAQKRNITIIPEIDMPGHFLAGLAAYPEYSCTGGPFRVLEYWGIQKDVLCAGNEKTYEFIEGILDEVIDLFPSPIIHVGGDEAPKDRWKECEKCQAKMKSENLKDEHELQSYFIKRVAKYLGSKGRKLLGWDEIMEGGLASNAMVMSWRGEKGGIEASSQKHQVVMSPSTYLYLDYYQGNKEFEPFNIGGDLPLEKVYSYEPHSDKISTSSYEYIIGVQGNIWMEFIHSEPKLEYMGFPRLLALAETCWSPKGKNYAEFTNRLQSNLLWLDKKDVNFRIPEPFGFGDNRTKEPSIIVTLTPPVTGAVILYTIDGGDPLLTGIPYSTPVSINLENGPVCMKCVVRTPKGRVSATYSAIYIQGE